MVFTLFSKPMLDACVQTIVRNGEDYLEPCILQVVDHVSTVKITIDSRSTDNTRDIAARLEKQFPDKIQVRGFQVEDPLVSLVAMRNSQLDFNETWGFIIDSDEFHYDVSNYHFGSETSTATAYAFQTFTPWTFRGKGRKASDRAVVGRVFKNKGVLQWRGTFGKEKLYRGDEQVFKEDKSKKEFAERYRDLKVLPHRYIHFTNLKQDDWRTELKQQREADDPSLYQLPDNIIRIIHNIHGERETSLPAVQGWN